MFTPNILTIAGSDSGGGAGIQADLKTMTMLGVYGSSVITALTAQNGLGVQGIYPSTPEFVALQLNTVLDGFKFAAAKTGMLFNEGIINAIADILEQKNIPLVIDPVCVSTSGHKLMEDSGSTAIKKRLFPLATVITPNIPEAEFFSGIKINNTDDAIEAGLRILDTGAKAVLVKGGHVTGKPIFVTDWLIEKNTEPIPLRQPHVDTDNTHGTGCTLSAAIASFLGLELPLKIAITKAQEFLNCALRHSFNPGKGHGPCNHMAWKR